MPETTAASKGCFVAVLGTDGSGKSSMIRRLEQELSSASLVVHRFHLRPGVSRHTAAEGGGAVTDPHRLPPYGTAVSAAKLFYLWLDYTIGYRVKVYPLLTRADVVLFDRYYHDLLVDTRRYRYGGPMWLARGVGTVIPEPDLWLLLDASPELIQSRKKELPPEEIRRQRKAYLELVRTKENAVVIDAAQPLETVVSRAVAQILNFISPGVQHSRSGPC